MIRRKTIFALGVPNRSETASSFQLGSLGTGLSRAGANRASRFVPPKCPRRGNLFRSIQKLRAFGRLNEARGLAISFQIENPDLIEPKVDLIRLYNEVGESALYTRTIDDLVRTSPKRTAAIMAAGDLVASVGDSALAMKLHQMVQPGTSEANSLLLLAIEADLTSAQYQEALERTKSFQKDHPNLTREHAPLTTAFRPSLTSAWACRMREPTTLPIFSTRPHHALHTC